MIPQKIKKISFSITYNIEGRDYSKQFSIVKKTKDLDKITSALERTKKEGKLNSILYYNPNNYRKAVYQTGLTNLGLLSSILIMIAGFIWIMMTLNLALVEIIIKFKPNITLIINSKGRILTTV